MPREAEAGLSAVAIAKAANARDSQVRELVSELESAVSARAAELEKRRIAKS